MTARWPPERVEELMARLLRFRSAMASPTALAEVERETRSPFAVLASCLISTRTRDEVTAVASRRLLSLAPTPGRLAALPEAEIAAAIYPAGFYRTKARHLRELGRALQHRYDARVPPDRELLMSLPGVGRKTANLVLGVGFGIPAICVDTHVHRLSNRLGLVRSSTPRDTEAQLGELLPREHWIEVNDLLVTFGQKRCHPTSPRCTGCPLADLCPRLGVARSR